MKEDSLRPRPWITNSLIENFARAQDTSEIARLADDLGAAGDPAAIDILIYRLGDNNIQSDPDLEDAVCSALVRLRVMEKCGNLNYTFYPEEDSSSEARVALQKHTQLIPGKYARWRDNPNGFCRK